MRLYEAELRELGHHRRDVTLYVARLHPVAPCQRRDDLPDLGPAVAVLPDVAGRAIELVHLSEAPIEDNGLTVHVSKREIGAAFGKHRIPPALESATIRRPVIALGLRLPPPV